jgi:hypothetical protein
MMRRITLFCAALLCVAATGVAQESRLMSFAMEDQFGQVHSDEEYRDQVVVVTAGDRKGGEYTVAWGRAMLEAMDPFVNLSQVRYIEVADLNSVPSLARKAVRKKFPKDELQWILLDWKGQWAKAYGFEKKAANILVFDASGTLLEHAHGQEPDQSQVQALADAIKTAVEEADTIILGRREWISHGHGSRRSKVKVQC